MKTLTAAFVPAAWFGGAGEGRPDVAVWGARRLAVPRHRSRAGVAGRGVAPHGSRFGRLAPETEASEFSYPAATRSADANVRVIYPWKRPRIRHVETPLAEIPK